MPALTSRLASALVRRLIAAAGFGLGAAPVASATPKGTIPATTVSLATYGGVPGATAAVNRQALVDAWDAIRTAGGGTITVPAGTYDMGEGNNGYQVTLDLCDNVMIDAYGATFSFASTSGGIPVLLLFAQCNNVNIYGLRFVDTTSNLEVTDHGVIAAGYGGFSGLTFSGFKMYDCEGQGLLSMCRTEGDAYSVSGISVHATLTGCYYGINNSNNGRNSEAFLTTNGCRRAIIMTGTSGWDIVVDHTPTIALQSNAFVSLYTADAAASSIEDMNVWLTIRGAMAYHASAITLQHQAEAVSSSPPLIDNVAVKLTVENLTSIGKLVWFVSYEPAIVANTARIWSGIRLSGSVDAASQTLATNNVINSESASTNGASGVVMSAQLAALQSLAGLPAYFTVN